MTLRRTVLRPCEVPALPSIVALAIVLVPLAARAEEQAPAGPADARSSASEAVADEDAETSALVVFTPAIESVVPDVDADSDETVTERAPLVLALRSEDGRHSLGLGMLLSVDYALALGPPESDSDGFRVTDARIVLLGDLGADWRYLVSGDFARAGAGLVDLRLTFEPAEWLRVHAGRFKVPVSGELLVPDADLDLIRLARVVSVVAPGRSVGLEVGGAWADRALFWRVGAFDGNADVTAGDASLLVAMRIGTRIPTGPGAEGRLTVAVNAAHGWDDGTMLGPFDAPFSGKRWIAGADVRGSWGPFSLVGEVLWARYEADDAAAQTVEIRGGHVTAIGRLTRWAQLLLRWDRLEDDRVETPRDLVIPSVAVAVPRVPPVQFQLDARIPVGAPDRTELIGNATVAF